MTKLKFATQIESKETPNANEKVIFDVLTRLTDDLRALFNKGVTVSDNLNQEIQTVTIVPGQDTQVIARTVKRLAGVQLVSTAGMEVTSQSVQIVGNTAVVNYSFTGSATLMSVLLIGD